MKKYTRPELIITSIKSQDIITASNMTAAEQLKKKYGSVFGEIDFF